MHIPPSQARQRESLFQQLCSDILREACDVPTLNRVGERALHNPGVAADPVLAGMLRAYIGERRGVLERDAAERRRLIEAEGAEIERVAAQALKAPEAPSTPAPPTREQILSAFERLRQELEAELVLFHESGSASALGRIEDMLRRYPAHISVEAVERCREDVRRFQARMQEFRKHIDEITEDAVAAAGRGDHEAVAKRLRQLSSLHASRPLLLTDARFEAIRRRITQASEDAEHRAAAVELVARERAVAAEIKKLATVIHQFHVAAQRVPHEGPIWKAAEAAYLKAAREVRSHDSEWLAELILELDTYLDEIHDPTGRAEAQVDRFLASVRAALTQMQAEMRAIQEEAERDAAKPAPAAEGRGQPGPATA